MIRGSEVISTSAVTWAYCCARAGIGPRRASAPCSPAEAAAAATQSSEAATETRGHARDGRAPYSLTLRALVRPNANNAPARTMQLTTTAVTRPGGAPTVTAAVTQTASAGGTSRRSVGPSSRGWAVPSRFPEAACTARRLRECRVLRVTSAGGEAAWGEEGAGVEGGEGSDRDTKGEEVAEAVEGPVGPLTVVRVSADRRTGGRRCH